MLLSAMVMRRVEADLQCIATTQIDSSLLLELKRPSSLLRGSAQHCHEKQLLEPLNQLVARSFAALLCVVFLCPMVH